MVTFNYNYQQFNNIQIHTTGCELCIYDARKFANILPSDEKAIVFNTCSFLYDREIENILLLDLLTKAFPTHKLYIMGCDVVNNPLNYQKYNNAIIYNNNQVNDIIRPVLNDKIKSNDTIYLKIQDGCRFKCSFCIINKLRNKPFSKPYKEILNELLHNIGEKSEVSVQLVGTELANYYDEETNFRIQEVIENLLKDIPKIKTLSIGTLDPASTNVERVIDVMNKYRNKMTPYINLAVQSGSNQILKQMRRRHNTERIRDIHNYASINNICVGWDLILGFPGETEELFQETLELVKELKPLTKTIFTYSPRKGTDAYDMDNQISECEKKKRLFQVIKIIESFLEDSSIPNEIKDIYKTYFQERIIDDDVTYKCDKSHLCDMIFNGCNEKELDIFNIEEFADFIRNPIKNYIINVNYDITRQLESEIYINFIKEYFKENILVVYIPKECDIDVKRFEKSFHCIVIKK
jgi:threonylcarbamoyladenosine tRNA methylthiotransferase MtaB